MQYSIESVFTAIREERQYQDNVWNDQTTTSGGQHSIEEFVLYMDDYMRQIKEQLTRNTKTVADQLALDTMRKIVSLGVCCMEQNGVVCRGTVMEG